MSSSAADDLIIEAEYEPELWEIASGTNWLSIVNDPVKVPEPKPSEGSYHWTFERFVISHLSP